MFYQTVLQQSALDFKSTSISLDHFWIEFVD